MRRWFSRPFAVCPIALLSFGLASCATEEFKYIPSEQLTSNARVTDEAVYSVPKDSPTTSVRVESGGIEKIKIGPESKDQPALHLKMAISNKTNKGEWKVDIREQTVSFPNAEAVQPVITQPGTAFQNQLTVPPGSLKTVDLYFPLPPSVRSSTDLPEFDFHWTLRSAEEAVRQTTLFDRVRKPEYAVATYPSAFYPYYFGVGPVWYGGVGAP